MTEAGNGSQQKSLRQRLEAIRDGKEFQDTGFDFRPNADLYLTILEPTMLDRRVTSAAFKGSVANPAEVTFGQLVAHIVFALTDDASFVLSSQPLKVGLD